MRPGSKTITDAQTTFSAQLTEAGFENGLREVQWLIQELLEIPRIEWITRPDAFLSSAQMSILKRAVERRLAREPLQYILGSASFYGREFKVDSRVLIPRPETEMLVEWAIVALGRTAGRNVLDLGTGSGCIPISLKLEVPDSACVGLDISNDALTIARQNALNLGADMLFAQADMLADDWLKNWESSIDVLLSNPPYIANDERDSLDSQVKDYEPGIALFSGDDPLLFYRALSGYASRLLTPTGVIGVEVHADHGEDVAELFRSAGLNGVELRKDLAHKNRMVVAKKGSI